MIFIVAQGAACVTPATRWAGSCAKNFWTAALDVSVRMISAEAPVVLARACELFVLELTLRAAKGQENEKVITRADVVAAIKNAATMDFLRGVVDPSMAPSADEIAAAEEEDL